MFISAYLARRAVRHERSKLLFEFDAIVRQLREDDPELVSRVSGFRDDVRLGHTVLPGITLRGPEHDNTRKSSRRNRN